LIVGGLVYFLAMYVITWRWWFLLRSLAQIPIMALYQLVAIGYMGNNVYPFRSGEVLRIVLLKQSYRVSYGRLTTTVLIERVFDGLVMLTFIIVPLLFIENAAPEIRRIATLSAPIFLTALVVFFVLALRPDVMRKLANLVTRFLPGKLGQLVQKLGDEVIAGLEGLRTPRDLAGTIIASYLSWMIEASVYWIAAMAFGLDVNYPIMLTVVGVVNLAGLIPASPGQIGVFEFFASQVLMGVGVKESEAIAFALLVHVAIWLPPTLLGFFFLIRRGLSFSAVTHARELEPAAEA
ncbi:MAG TPA: lysylphosphatidylglycerol synthase transmembrane domain-containing protein, partial [Phototrophicaceae bacterium]|nr:lysylphosphatidylglycerol synthase transmembrane domain-containing protein [Phototrophicaceae bacterium]